MLTFLRPVFCPHCQRSTSSSFLHSAAHRRVKSWVDERWVLEVAGWARSHYVSVFVSWLCALLLVCPRVRVLVFRCPSPITAPDISSVCWPQWPVSTHWLAALKKEWLIKCVMGQIHIPFGFISCILLGETPMESISKEGGMLKVIGWPLSFSHSSSS